MFPSNPPRDGRLKVLWVTPWYPMATKPHFGVFVQRHAIAASRFCDVVVIHVGAPDPGAKQAWNVVEETDPGLTAGIPCYRVTFRGESVDWRSLAARAAGFARAVRDVRRQHGRFDVVHANVFTSTMFALPIARWWRTPLVVTEHWSGILRKSLPRAEACLMRWSLRHADKVLPVSRALQHAMEEQGVRAPFHVVPNAVDTDEFAPLSCPAPGAEAIRLLAVATLVEAKGLAVLLRALGVIPAAIRWHLDVVGDGPDRGHLERLAASLGIGRCVTFHGALRPAEVPRLTRRADLYVLPSFLETFSVSAAEALCSGVPVLATRCGGPEEFIDEDCGMLLPSRNVDAMARGLEAMLRRLPDFDRPAMARRASARFGYDAVGATLLSLYRETLDARP